MRSKIGWCVRMAIEINKKITVTLYESQIQNIAEFIEMNLINVIREDVDIDNFMYVCGMCDAYRRLNEAMVEKGE